MDLKILSNVENIESVVRKLIEDENVDNKEKLLKALKHYSA